VKRGWITWDKSELPQAAFDSRLNAARAEMTRRDLDAIAVYSDLWRSNQGRYYSNYMAYFNRAFSVIPRDGKPVLLCGLSPRVYPWIKTVTIFDEVLASPNLPKRLLDLAAEKSWKRIGVVDLDGLPNDLHTQIRAGAIELVDVPWRNEPDQWELAMYRKAAKMAREILAEELPAGPGLTDHEFVGRLERRFRRAGAEDLIILIANGDTPPIPAHGEKLGEDFSVTLALEYRGHWVKISRAQTSVKIPDIASAARTFEEKLSGPYPYDPGSGGLFTKHLQFQANGRRLFHGDSYWQGPNGAELL
jgi:hypothetical protein